MEESSEYIFKIRESFLDMRTFFGVVDIKKVMVFRKFAFFRYTTSSALRNRVLSFHRVCWHLNRTIIVLMIVDRWPFGFSLLRG